MSYKIFGIEDTPYPFKMLIETLMRYSQLRGFCLKTKSRDYASNRKKSFQQLNCQGILSHIPAFLLSSPLFNLVGIVPPSRAFIRPFNIFDIFKVVLKIIIHGSFCSTNGNCSSAST